VESVSSVCIGLVNSTTKKASALTNLHGRAQISPSKQENTSAAPRDSLSVQMKQADMPSKKKQKKNEPPHMIGRDNSGATIERRQERDRASSRPPTTDKDDDNAYSNGSTEQVETTIHRSGRSRRQHLRGVVLRLPPTQPLRAVSRKFRHPHHHNKSLRRPSRTHWCHCVP
jgi:hypothetical protein